MRGTSSQGKTVLSPKGICEAYTRSGEVPREPHRLLTRIPRINAKATSAKALAAHRQYGIHIHLRPLDLAEALVAGLARRCLALQMPLAFYTQK